eukprot:COSAG04_NODE_7248_length_1160_cov_1.168709_2_plen_332_part_01
MVSLFVYKVQTAVPVDGEQGVSAVSKAVVNSFSNPMKLVAMFTATFSKKFYTALVCVDYMVATIVADRKYEKALLELKRPPQSEGCCAKKPDARDEVDDGIRMHLADGTVEEGGVKEAKKPAAKSKRCGRSKDEGEELDGEPQMTEEEEMLELVKNKQVRLDDLCRLMYVGDDEEWMAKKEQGIAAARKMRESTWQAATQARQERPKAGLLSINIHNFKVVAQKEVYVVLELEQKDENGVPQTDTFASDHVPCVSGMAVLDEGVGEFQLPIYDASAVKLYIHAYEDVVGYDTFLGEALIDTPSIIEMITQAGQPQQPRQMPLSRCTQPIKVQ